jgi:hypothetical protein
MLTNAKDADSYIILTKQSAKSAEIMTTMNSI